jgi:hypothetical protein
MVLRKIRDILAIMLFGSILFLFVVLDYLRPTRRRKIVQMVSEIQEE